ncbi:MAG TPA: ABC transporter substrate-binding protein [Burkholderiales bacterium]|nr:ABC transporter substrate-binding protein [Burkholderiales bacterium]
MSDRRTFLSLLALGLLLSVRQGKAQPGKVFRIGMFNQPGPRIYEELILAGLQKLGYVEGQNLLLERSYGTPQELPALASNLVRLNVDLIACGGSAAVRALMGATRKIPVVAVDLETDPVAQGFASSLAHPGGNLTGFFLDLPEFSAKRLEILKETLPTVTRVVALWDPAMDRGPVNAVRSAAQALNLRLFVIEVPDGSTLEAAFKEAIGRKAGAVLNMHSPGLDAYKAQILELAAQYRLPLMALFANFAADGAVLSYGPNIEDLTSRMAVYIDKILKGTRPGDLPIERPAKFDFVVNLQTAKILGLKVPQSILARADEVIR